MQLKFVSTLFLSGLFGIAGLTYADSITYTYTTISVPGGSSTVARGINNVGEIVGTYNDSSGQGHGFIYNNGAYTTVNAPGGTGTGLLGVNNLGQIVGTYRDSSNVLQLFVDNSGVFNTINVPGGLSPIYPYGPLEAGINDAGQIVSTTIVQGSGPHAFLYSNGQFSLIPPGSGPTTSTYAGGINNAGQIAITISSEGSGSYIYSNGNLTGIPTPPEDSYALGIDNAGDVFGHFESTNTSGTYLYSNGTLTTFDPNSSPNLYDISGINDAGQRIGRGPGGAVLATPNTTATPEPSSFLLLGCGLSGLAFVARVRFKKAQR